VAYLDRGEAFNIPNRFNPNAGGSRLNDYTVNMMVKFINLNNTISLISFDSSWPNTSSSNWKIGTNGKIFIGDVSSNVTIDAQRWYFLTLVVSGSTGSFTGFINGSLAIESNTNDSNLPSIDGNWSIGDRFYLLGSDSYSQMGQVRVGELSLYNQTLTPEQIVEITKHPGINVDEYFKTMKNEVLLNNGNTILAQFKDLTDVFVPSKIPEVSGFFTLQGQTVIPGYALQLLIYQDYINDITHNIDYKAVRSGITLAPLIGTSVNAKIGTLKDQLNLDIVTRENFTIQYIWLRGNRPLTPSSNMTSLTATITEIDNLPLTRAVFDSSNNNTIILGDRVEVQQLDQQWFSGTVLSTPNSINSNYSVRYDSDINYNILSGTVVSDVAPDKIRMSRELRLYLIFNRRKKTDLDEEQFYTKYTSMLSFGTVPVITFKLPIFIIESKSNLLSIGEAINVKKCVSFSEDVTDLVYQWQVKRDNWTDIQDANSTSYTIQGQYSGLLIRCKITIDENTTFSNQLMIAGRVVSSVKTLKPNLKNTISRKLVSLQPETTVTTAISVNISNLSSSNSQAVSGGRSSVNSNLSTDVSDSQNESTITNTGNTSTGDSSTTTEASSGSTTGASSSNSSNSSNSSSNSSTTYSTGGSGSTGSSGSTTGNTGNTSSGYG